MSYEFEGFAQQGWQCPVCKRVYSPTTPMCLYCGKSEVTTTTTIKSIIDDAKNFAELFMPKED